MNNLATRSVTGVFYVLVMVGSALLGQNVFSVLLLIITILSLNEYVSIVSNDKLKPSLWLTLIVGGLMYVLLTSHAMGFVTETYLILIIPLIFLLFIFELWRNRENPFMNIAMSLLGILYIALPLGLLMYFFDPVQHTGSAHSAIVLGFLFILWLNDTGAYLAGSLFGKHKLFERISPGKTWEGIVGGVILGLLTSWGLSFVFIQLDVKEWLILALIIIVAGTLGDLVESMLKRSLGIKDSGTILPGHGGMLDRLDSIFLAAPFVFVYLALFTK